MAIGVRKIGISPQRVDEATENGPPFIDNPQEGGKMCAEDDYRGRIV